MKSFLSAVIVLACGLATTVWADPKANTIEDSETMNIWLQKQGVPQDRKYFRVIEVNYNFNYATLLHFENSDNGEFHEIDRELLKFSKINDLMRIGDNNGRARIVAYHQYSDTHDHIHADYYTLPNTFPGKMVINSVASGEGNLTPSESYVLLRVIGNKGCLDAFRENLSRITN